jgi:hypothetical protein
MFTETSLRDKMMTKIAERLKTFTIESDQSGRQLERDLATKISRRSRSRSRDS